MPLCFSLSYVVAERLQLLCHPPVYYIWQPSLLTDDSIAVAHNSYVTSPANSYTIIYIYYIALKIRKNIDTSTIWKIHQVSDYVRLRNVGPNKTIRGSTSPDFSKSQVTVLSGA